MNYIHKHSEREGVAMVGVSGIVAVIYFLLEVLDCVNMFLNRKATTDQIPMSI